MNAIERLRAMGADFQDILSGPEVDRWMADVAAVDALYQAQARLLRWVELITGPRVGEGTYAANDDVFEIDGRSLYNLRHAAEPVSAAVRRVEGE